MADFPLAKTQVIWRAINNPELPAAALVLINGEDDDRYHSSWGACNKDFSESSDEKKVVMLLHQFIHMTVNHHIDAKELHEIFMQIPEYRRELADSGVIDPAGV